MKANPCVHGFLEPLAVLTPTDSCNGSSATGQEPNRRRFNSLLTRKLALIAYQLLLVQVLIVCLNECE